MSERNKLTIVCGNAGVGKTTLGGEIARRTGAVLLDIDTVSERLVAAGLRARGADPTDRDSAEFKNIYRDAIHQTLFHVAEENLDNVPCVIVAPFTQERRRDDFLERLEKAHRCPVEIIYVTCSDEVRKSRIIDRKNPRDLAKLQTWDDYARAGTDTIPPPYKHTRIESDK